VRDDPQALALSRGGVGADSHNGERLAALLTTPLDSAGQTSLAQRYEQWVSGTAQASALSQAVTEGDRLFHATLEGEHLGLSGVSLDEEAVQMMTLQRTFQAAAKVISTVNELLEVLVEL
jgi:flagellar hook-associated protein 1 FlgK